MEVGTVSFKNDKLVKRVHVATKDKEYIRWVRHHIVEDKESNLAQQKLQHEKEIRA